MNSEADPVSEALAAAVATAPAAARSDLRERAARAARAAAQAAAAVDVEARFPEETFAVLRAERLLGMQVPVELGGDGASMGDVVDTCYALGRACGSSGMIFAMHQIMVAILVRHARSSVWHEGLLERIAAEQLLMASSTTENQTGGDVRNSACVVQPDGPRMSLVKNATVMSYGAQADGILTTARRAEDAQPSDQVLVAFVKGDYELERIAGWDVLGMRGTCSTGFTVRGKGLLAQVLPEPYDKIHAHSMMPVAHLTWGGVWSGVAAGAVMRARNFVRNAARHAQGQVPPGAAHLTRAVMSLRALRAMLSSALQRFENISLEDLESLDFQTEMNLLKVNASEFSIQTVLSCMQACGLSGYRNDGEFSISRSLRDILSTSIMINNDRILANAAKSALMIEVPAHLRD